MTLDPGLAANTALLEDTVLKLGDVADDLVFVGGCATGLLLTRVRAQVVRVTVDVDVIAEVTTLHEYHALEKRIAARGFKHDPDVICRWRSSVLQLDVVPSGTDILGFRNRWYPLAVSTAKPIALPSGREIRLVSGPLFLATKLEAFRDRGNGDFIASHDLEDIVTVIDGRPEVVGEVSASSPELRTFLRVELAALLGDEAFLDALPAYLPGDAGSQGRLPEVLQRIRLLANP